MLRLTIIEEPDGDKPDSATLVVGPGGATVGRTRDNTWILPDHQNLLSRAHFEIQFESGTYLVLDRSTNGTFVNEEKAPIGRGKSVPVQDGDVIGLGGYKIEVALEAIGAEPEPMLGDRPDFLGVDSVEAPPEFESPPLIPDTDSPGFGDAVEIPDAFAAIEPQQIPDGLFGSASGSANSAETAGLPDLEIGPAALRDSPERPPDLGSGFGSGQPPEPGPDPQERPNLFVPVVPSADPPKEQSAPYLSTPPPPEERVPQDDSFLASSSPASGSAGGAIPEDWLLEADDPPPAAAIVNPAEPAFVPSNPPPFGNSDQRAAPPPPSRPAAPAAQPAVDGNELESGIRRAVSGALGSQADAMGHVELVRVVEEMSAMVQASAPELMRAMSSRTQFKDHMRLDQTMVRAQDNNPLKFCTDPGDALARMLLNDQPGLLQGRLAVAEAFRQLAAHQTALFAALQPALEETVEKFSPAAIEAAAREEGGMGFSLSSGKGKLWDTYQQVFARLADSERGRLEEFFMKSLAQHYERCLKTLG